MYRHVAGPGILLDLFDDWRLCLGEVLVSYERTQQCRVAESSELFRQPLPGLPHVTPGYSMGLKSVRQPEPGLRRVAPLALATGLLGNSQ